MLRWTQCNRPKGWIRRSKSNYAAKQSEGPSRRKEQPDSQAVHVLHIVRPSFIRLQTDEDGFVDTCSTQTSQTSCTEDTYCRWYKDDAGMDTWGTFQWDPMEGVGDGEHLKMDANCKKITELAQCNYNEHICPNPDFEVMDEGGNCVPKLWPDWVSCEEDMGQGSCPSKENDEVVLRFEDLKAAKKEEDSDASEDSGEGGDSEDSGDGGDSEDSGDGYGQREPKKAKMTHPATA